MGGESSGEACREAGACSVGRVLAEDGVWLSPACCQLPAPFLGAPGLGAGAGAGAAGARAECGKGMQLPARACWHPPTRVTARISGRDMSAAAGEEETNGLGGEAGIFPPSQNERALLGAQGRGEDCCFSATAQHQGRKEVLAKHGVTGFF